MVRPPSPAEEDERRLTREREALVIERTRHVNRIKGLLATQGVFGFERMLEDHRKQLQQLRGWDGQALPPRLKADNQPCCHDCHAVSFGDLAAAQAKFARPAAKVCDTHPVEVTQQVGGGIAEQRHRQQRGARVQGWFALEVGSGDCAVSRPGQNGEPRSDLQEMHEAILSPSAVNNRISA